jgi:AbrB family looped-hinge helix DNA binding protein
MSIAQSKLTSQGQVSVPAEVRKRLAVGPGSVLEWAVEGNRIVVRRAGKYTSEDIHRALFNSPPKPRTLEQLKAARAAYIKKKHARD